MPICAAKRRPRTAGGDDGRHQAAQLAQHTDAEQIDGEDIGAEAAQLIGSLIGEDHADQERQQADDRHCVQAGFLHLVDQGRNAQAAWVQDGRDGFVHDQAEEADEFVTLVERMKAATADAFQPSGQGGPWRLGDRWRTAFVVDRVDQGAIFRIHMHRPHRDAALFQGSLGTQQQPGADRIQPLDRADVEFGILILPGIECPQQRIEAARLGTDPPAASHQAERAVALLGPVPRSVRQRRRVHQRLRCAGITARDLACRGTGVLKNHPMFC